MDDLYEEIIVHQTFGSYGHFFSAKIVGSKVYLYCNTLASSVHCNKDAFLSPGGLSSVSNLVLLIIYANRGLPSRLEAVLLCIPSF